jgi:hypothetical protein
VVVNIDGGDGMKMLGNPVLNGGQEVGFGGQPGGCCQSGQTSCTSFEKATAGKSCIVRH